jgi:prepilin-type processing-associated H-X9-DG protein
LLPIYQCPSTNGYPRVIQGFGAGRQPRPSAGALDYAGYFGASRRGGQGVWCAINTETDWNFETPHDVISREMVAPPRLASIEDGLSNTLIVYEQAAKPLSIIGQTREMPPLLLVGAWLTSEAGQIERSNGINQDNYYQLYSDHPGLAHILMCDGAVRVVREGTPREVLNALVSRAGGEVVDIEELR